MPIPKSRLGRLRIRQLQLFEHLFETGSIRNAAIRIGVTQPAASEMLREIEDVFGLRLFDRARRGVVPLPGARALLERVRIVLRELETAGVELEVSTAGSLPRLRVGAVQHAVVQLFPKAVAEMLTGANATRIMLREGSINNLVEQIKLGELDCVIGRLSPDHFSTGSSYPVVFWRIVDDPLCVVCAATHPLAGKRRITLADLTEYAWALPAATGLTTRLVHQVFLHAGLPLPPTLVESDHMASSVAICSGTKLLTVAASAESRRQEQLGLVRVLPIDFDLDAPPLALICRAGSAQSSAVIAFRDSLIRAANTPATRNGKQITAATKPARRRKKVDVSVGRGSKG